MLKLVRYQHNITLSFRYRSSNGTSSVSSFFGCVLEDNDRLLIATLLLLPGLIFKYHRNGLLYWHDGRIPSDEVWLKIGGDKGGGTFKMAVQIVNVRNPNAPKISIFERPDRVTNLTVLANTSRQQINSLESKQCK